MDGPSFMSQINRIRSSVQLGLFNKLEGLIFAIIGISILEIFSRAGNPVRNFLLILQTLVVYAALRGAVPGAILASLAVWLYSAYFLSSPDHFFQFTSDNLQRLLVVTVTIPLTALMVGFLRRKLERVSYEKAIQKTNEDLKREEERYRAFIEHSTEAIWRCELSEPMPTSLSLDAQVDYIYEQGYLAECNKAMARMYGFENPEDIEGAKISDLLVREDPNNVAYLKAFIGSGYKLENAESHERDNQGKDKYFLNNLIGIIENGKLLRAWGTQRDVTQSRQAEAYLRRSEWQQRFLSTASGILSSSLDSKKILSTLAQVTVPDFADWCAIDVVNAKGEVERVAVVHPDPDKVAWALEVHKKFPDQKNSDQGVAAVIKNGETKLYATIDDEMLVRSAQNEEHLTLLRGLGVSSVLIVPMTAYGKTLGAITLVYTESGRTYSEQDVSFATDFGNRAAMAVFNANLYEGAQDIAISEFEHSIFLETLLATAPVGLGFLNRNLEYIRVNQYLADIHGLPIEQHIGKKVGEVFPQLSSKTEQLASQVIQTGNPMLDIEISSELRGSPDHVRHWLASYYPVHGRDGKIIGAGLVVDEITERKQAEETIKHQAHHDALTNLPNRKSLEERLIQAITIAKRNEQGLGIIFCDLDRFKKINDTLGHDVGDIVLKEVAKRLKSAVRDEDTVARLGGDEFIIMLPELPDAHSVRKVTDKIFAAMNEPIYVSGQAQPLHTTTSLGVAFYPEDGTDPATLLKNADTALYRAKEAGRNTVQLYNQAMSLEATEKLSLEHDLRIAQNTDQLELFYQPIVDCKDGRTAGLEALLRWRHPKLGLMLPHEFLPLAEETGVITSMTDLVISKACKDFREFANNGFSDGKLVVNLSGQQFGNPNLSEIVHTALVRENLNPAILELEITENTVMHNLAFSISKMKEIRDMGVSISVDDFGTGYSSLNYLKRFPLQKLKIDKSFIRNCLTEERDAAIIRAIISMAHSLQFKVTAEGIETDSQYRFIRSLGADYAQGFYISHPLSKTETIRWVVQKKNVTVR